MIGAAMGRRACVLLIGVGVLGACNGPTGPGYAALSGGGATGAGGAPRPLVAAPPTARPVALLAPLTGPNAERGRTLVNAAKLALDAPGAPELDVRDTGGTPQGAAEAARAAIAGGAGLILGPLTAGETAGAAGVARAAGVPILAFTNDATQAQPGVWTLGITPGEQVRRLVGAELSRGKNRFVAVLPQNDFGAAMGAALSQAATTAGAPAPTIRTYQATGADMDAAIRDVADYNNRVAPLMDQLRIARDQNSPDKSQKLTDLTHQPMPPPPFDALLVGEFGARLVSLTGVLASYEVTSENVRLLGPAQWSDPSARGGAPLNGAWYAAPDPTIRTGYDAQYTARYGTPAPGIADVAYDAAAVARVLAQGGAYTVASLCRADGFDGVDGVFALRPDGRVRRGLALFEIGGGTPRMIEPAPKDLAGPGI